MNISTPPPLTHQSKPTCAIVIGANGGIGSAVIDALQAEESLDIIFAISRTTSSADSSSANKTVWLKSDSSETSIEKVCGHIADFAPVIKYVVIATGTLHNQEKQRMPEKRLGQLNKQNLSEVLEVNAMIPLLWLKSLSPLHQKKSDTRIAVLSARVGSIEDNSLGGWYSYRASKAALNMLLKTLAIEYRRRFPAIKIISFHPGTTDTCLSEPFQANVPQGKLFKPAFVASQLLSLMANSPSDGELSFVDWEHKAIPW